MLRNAVGGLHSDLVSWALHEGAAGFGHCLGRRADLKLKKPQIAPKKQSTPRKEDQEAKLRQKMTWKFRELDEEVPGLGVGAFGVPVKPYTISVLMCSISL